MRWPIRQQLLVPFLAVVVGALVLASLVNAYLNAEWARQRQEEDLRRLTQTIGSGGFPLMESVLGKMSGLSGAEFVVLDRGNQILLATLPLDASDQTQLSSWVDGLAGESLDSALVWQGRQYQAQRVAVAGQPALPRASSVVVLFPAERWWAESRQVIIPPLVVGLVASLAVIGLTTWLARRFTGRIEALRGQALAIERGEFQPATVPRTNDELRDLSLSLNQMAAQLSRYEQQVRSNERLRTLGQLGGGIAHQLRNSVAGALLALELHERECPLGMHCETTVVVHRQLDLMRTYLQRFLTLGRGPTGPRRPLQLRALIEEVLPLVQPLGTHTHVALTFRSAAAPTWLMGDTDALRLLLVNLILNAIEAAGQTPQEPGAVLVELLALEDWLELRVIDSGPGPAAEVREHLFEPFTSEKPDGTGLGLSVARQVAEQHGGRIEWRRERNETWFVVTLPRCVAPALEAGESHTAPLPV